MKLIIIRHGDPDYSIDSLTEKGWKEAKLLADRVAKIDAKDIYCSPLGRAKDTASFSLERLGRKAIELEWLREFPIPINRPDRPWRDSVAWDWYPADWLADERMLSKDHWMENEVYSEANVYEEYKRIIENFDKLLADHGYVRDGLLYKAVKPNNDTLVFFCHFGLECVLLSHLLHVSPLILWQGTCAAPTSVTTVVTEERTEGLACFRMSAFGDISHLYVADEEPAFAARFCECYSNSDERHD